MLRETGPVTSEATLLPVDDPFEKALELDFVPLFNPATTALAFVDVEYADAANNYFREERLALSTLDSTCSLRAATDWSRVSHSPECS